MVKKHRPISEPGEVVFTDYQTLDVGSNFTPERNDYIEYGWREAEINAPAGWQYRILRPLSSATPATTSWLNTDPVRANLVNLADGETVEVKNVTGGASDACRIFIVRK